MLVEFVELAGGVGFVGRVGMVLFGCLGDGLEVEGLLMVGGEVLLVLPLGLSDCDWCGVVWERVRQAGVRVGCGDAAQEAWSDGRTALLLMVVLPFCAVARQILHGRGLYLSGVRPPASSQDRP